MHFVYRRSYINICMLVHLLKALMWAFVQRPLPSFFLQEGITNYLFSIWLYQLQIIKLAPDEPPSAIIFCKAGWSSFSRQADNKLLYRGQL